MRTTMWMRAVALAAISMPALAFGKGPLPAGYDDATCSEDAAEAQLAATAAESGTWGPLAAGHDDATHSEGTIGLHVPEVIVAAGPLPAGRDDATYGAEAPTQQGRALARAIASVSQATRRQAPTSYDPTLADGLAPWDEGEGWASADGVRVAGAEYEATAPDGNVPGAVVSPARVVELRVTEKGFEPAEVVLERGEAVKLVVTRTTERTCARRILVEGEGIDSALPLGQAVTLSLLPRKSGSIHYACATGKIAGALIIR